MYGRDTIHVTDGDGIFLKAKDPNFFIFFLFPLF